MSAACKECGGLGWIAVGNLIGNCWACRKFKNEKEAAGHVVAQARALPALLEAAEGFAVLLEAHKKLSSSEAFDKDPLQALEAAAEKEIAALECLKSAIAAAQIKP